MPDADLDALLGRAADAPYGPGKVTLLEAAVALADSTGAEELGFAVRQELLWPAYHGSRPDLVLVHFAWCLAYLDRNPEHPPFETLWQYRWVVDTMPNFAAVTRAQIEAASADMHDRYKAGGWSLRPVWLNRRRACAKMGDAAAAADAHRRYVRARRDAMSDGAGQDAAFAVDYAAFRRDDRLAVELGRGLLAASDQAQDVISAVDDSLMALARRRGWDEAAANVARVLRLLARNRQFYGSTHHLVAYLTVTGDLAAAVRLFDKDFPALAAEPGEFGRVSGYKAALYLTRRLTDAGRNRLALKVPAGFVPGEPGDRVTPGRLRDHLEAALPALCAQADKRNGNSYHTDRLADLDEFSTLAADYARSRP